jgi:hypothetical protein
MESMHKKDIVHHFLLNLLTVLDFMVREEETAEESRKGEILNLLKIAGLIISNEKVFLDEKPEFFVQEIHLNDILEIVTSIYQKSLDAHGVTVVLPEMDHALNIDRHYFGEAMKYIVERLIPEVSFVNFEYDENGKILSVLHDGGIIAPDLSKSLSSFLAVKGISKNDIIYRLALALLEMQDMQVKFKENKIEIKLV